MRSGNFRDAGIAVHGFLVSAMELRRENRRLREDAEILKRAMAFFAREAR